MRCATNGRRTQASSPCMCLIASPCGVVATLLSLINQRICITFRFELLEMAFLNASLRLLFWMRYARCESSRKQYHRNAGPVARRAQTKKKTNIDRRCCKTKFTKNLPKTHSRSRSRSRSRSSYWPKSAEMMTNISTAERLNLTVILLIFFSNFFFSCVFLSISSLLQIRASLFRLMLMLRQQLFQIARNVYFATLNRVAFDLPLSRNEFFCSFLSTLFQPIV